MGHFGPHFHAHMHLKMIFYLKCKENMLTILLRGADKSSPGRTLSTPPLTLCFLARPLLIRPFHSFRFPFLRSREFTNVKILKPESEREKDGGFPRTYICFYV